MLYFIVNHTSRTGKASLIWREIKAKLDEENVTYKAYETKEEGHATRLSAKITSEYKTICDEEYCNLIIVGGDGTMNEVLNGIQDFNKVRLGMIPTGSGNDFGRGLLLSDNPISNLELIMQNANRSNNELSANRIDIGNVTYKSDDVTKSRLFGISAGLGFDAIVCEKALHSKLKKFLNKLGLGKLTYIILTVQTLFSMETCDAQVEFIENSGTINKIDRDKLIFIAAMNLRCEGGGVPMAPRADACDNMLHFSSAYGITKWRTFFCLPFLTAAKHEKLKGFDVTSAKKARVILSKPTTLHADGECMLNVTEGEFEVLENKLIILNRLIEEV